MGAADISFDDLIPPKKVAPKDISFDDLLPGGTTKDVLKSMAAAPGKAAVGLAGMAGDASDLAPKARSWLADKIVPDEARPTVDKIDSFLGRINPIAGMAQYMPKSATLRSAIESITGPWHEPQSTAGRIADTATQAATTMGRSLLTAPLKAGLTVAGITGGTEGAGALTDQDPLARAAGGLLGGGAVAGAAAATSKPGALVRSSVGKMTEAEIAAANARQAAAADQGVPLLGTESMDRGHQLASAVNASPAGNAIISPFVNKRPEQVENAVKTGLLAETGNNGGPQVNAARAQSAADTVIGNAEQARSAAVSPFYKAAQTETIDPQTTGPIADQLRALIKGAPSSSPSSSAISSWAKQLFPNGIPELNAGKMNEIYKSLGIAGDTGSIGASSADRMAAYPAQQLRGPVAAAVKSNPNIAQAQQTYADMTRNNVEPLTSGPVGIVAGRSGFDPSAPSPVPRVLSTVADSNTARPETIRRLYTNLNATDPKAFPGMVQTHIENKLNDALGSLRSGPNPTAGAKFYDAIAGTPQDKANFEEMMRGVAQAQGKSPDAVVDGAKNLLKTMDLTGRTPGIGSPTATRSQIDQAMSGTKTGDIMRSLSTHPFSAVANRLDQWVNGGRYADLAKVLTDPDSVNLLVKMAKLKPSGVTAGYYAASLLGIDKAIAP